VFPRIVVGFLPMALTTRDHRGYFAAGREAKHADSVRIDTPLLRAAPDQPNGPLAVGQSMIGDLVGRAFLASKTVLEDEGRDTVLVQPLC